MREQVIAHIMDQKIIAIVRRIDPKSLITLAHALKDGGLSLIEVTFDQENPDSWQTTCQGIAALNDHFGGSVMVGAGTVLTIEQMAMACEAGARYIISPNANPQIIRSTVDSGMVSIPGCMTPTEVAAALDAGADFIKLFPVSALGSSYVKAIRAPLGHARMLAVGGVNEKNAPEFLAAGCVGIGVGGNLVNKNWVAEGKLDEIRNLAQAYVAAVGRK